MSAPTIWITGTVGRDAELRFTASGKAVANFSVACTERKRGSDGKWVDGETTWFDVTAWERLGENVAESIRKGQQVVVQGRQKLSTFEGRDGVSRTKLEIIANEVAPSLRNASAEVKKVARTAESGASDRDQWSTPSQPAAQQAQLDEPPF